MDFFSLLLFNCPIDFSICHSHTEYYLDKVKFVLGKGEEMELCLNCRTQNMVCFQGGQFSRETSEWRELTLSFESALGRVRKVKVFHWHGKCKYAELNFKLHYFIITSCSALNMEEELQKVLPHVSEKSCSDPVFPTKSQAAMNCDFGAPAAVSSRAEYKRIAQRHTLTF